MKRIICKHEYDTESATVIEKRAFSFYGDPAGYEETLYITPEGKYFLYTYGGAQSKYPVEKIRRKSAKTAELWLKNE